MKKKIDEWLVAAAIGHGRLFRKVSKWGKSWGEGMTEKTVWHIVKEAANRVGVPKVAPHDLRRYAVWKIMPSRPSNPLWFAGFLSDDSA